MKGYDAWLSTTPEDDADYYAARRARRDAIAEQRIDAEPCGPEMYGPAKPSPMSCLRWNPETGRAEPGTFNPGHSEDYIA